MRWIDRRQQQKLGIAGLSTSVGTDLFIGLALCYYLHKSRTGFRKYVMQGVMRGRGHLTHAYYLLYRSDDMITKLIVITVSTGLLTAYAHMCL